MGLCSWFSVILVVFATGLQTEAKHLSWHKPEQKYQTDFSEWFAHYPPKKAHSEDSFGEPSLQEPLPAVQEPAQEPVRFQSKQTLQGPVKQLSWRFPKMPEKPKKPKIPFDPKEPIPADSVAVRCGEADVQVEVKQDFFGTGQLIHPADLSLGDCSITGDDPSAQVLVLESELHKCGSKLQMTEDELVYTFTLAYTPKALPGSPIRRTNGATVAIECRYPREHNVSSDALMPTWVPFAATEVAEEAVVFSLRLMTDDWKFKRASNTYYLGDVLHIEASVIQYYHAPLRVFVPSCVATAVPDVSVLPRYSFIENHGCFVDAKLTGSRSHFLPRAQDDKMQFELEAFRFAEGAGTTIYITCQLVATSSTVSDNKACSYIDDQWASAEGNDEVCRCCDSTCEVGRKARDVSADKAWESEAFLGPIIIQDAY